MELIPAVDIIGGKCVRLTQGDFAKVNVYNENPIEVAKQFQDIGIRRLHLVDLDGAKNGFVVNYKVLEGIAAATNLIIDFGGGIKSEESIKIVFESGASIVTIGSLAVKNKTLFYSWIKKYGAEKLLLGADAKNEKITIAGWQEETDISIYDFVSENIKNGVQSIFCTDVSKDGMLLGPALDLYDSILKKNLGLKLIASGGISSIKDLDQLKMIGCSGAIVGKAIYENKISMKELKNYLKK